EIRAGEKQANAVAEANGPGNPLDSALREALARFYPEHERAQLTDYKVCMLYSTGGIAVKTRVLIESTDGKEEWATVGVSENIIDASLQALMDSMEYRLMRRAKPHV